MPVDEYRVILGPGRVDDVDKISDIEQEPLPFLCRRSFLLDHRDPSPFITRCGQYNRLFDQTLVAGLIKYRSSLKTSSHRRSGGSREAGKETFPLNLLDSRVAEGQGQLSRRRSAADVFLVDMRLGPALSARIVLSTVRNEHPYSARI
jgi:hypothetical protein